jgi:signal transduction histidine kinase
LEQVCSTVKLISVPTPRFDVRRVSAMSLAGYAAWATTAFGVWRAAASWAPLGGVPGQTLAGALLASFLVAFLVLTTSAEPLGRATRLGTLGVLIAATFGLLCAGPPELSPILLIIVAVALVEGYPPLFAWTALLLLNACFYALVAWRWQADDAGFVVLVFGSFQAFAAVTAGARAKAEKAADELRQVNAGLLATRALLAESARDAERLRVSRELHDVAGHRLTALKLNLDVLGLEPALAGRREIVVAQQLTAELLGDVRSVVSRLRHDDGIDIREALRRIAEPFPRPAIHLEIPEDARVEGAERADALVRACQEALTNAVRHAEATNIWVSLVARGTGVEMVVRDDGAYTGSHVPGYGLTGMRERVEQAGGSVATARSAGGGFEVTVRLAGAAG